MWEDKNIRYRLVGGVETPLEVLRRRVGKCVDYSVFTVAALLAYGYREAYAISIDDVASGSHMFAAAPVNNTIIVFDQHLPPCELGDYLQYNFGHRPLVFNVYRVVWRGNMTLVETGTSVEIPAVDVWPQDTLPENISLELARTIARDMGVRVDPSLARRRIGPIATLYMYLPRCGSFTRLYVSCGKVYTPVLHGDWVRWLALMVEKELRNSGVRVKSIWVEVRRLKNDYSIRVYYEYAER